MRDLLETCDSFPVEDSQIYGLRQLARQQPDKVKSFARHQRERAERKNYKGQLQAEIDFWSLVEQICNVDKPGSGWSLAVEVQRLIPDELRQIPARHPQMTQEERTHRNQIVQKRRGWLAAWQEDHIPAFFERFCTHCLYSKTLMAKKRQ